VLNSQREGDSEFAGLLSGNAGLGLWAADCRARKCGMEISGKGNV